MFSFVYYFNVSIKWFLKKIEISLLESLKLISRLCSDINFLLLKNKNISIKEKDIKGKKNRLETDRERKKKQKKQEK